MDVPRVLDDVLAIAVERFPQNVTLTAPEGGVTNRDLAGVVAGAAGRLADAGIGAGHRVAVCLRSGLESAVAFFACARLGARLVALNTRLAPDQWAAQLAHARPRLVLAHPEWMAGVKTAWVSVGGDDVHEAGRPGPGPGGALLADPVRWEPAPPVLPDDDFAILYTSGTTGRPKGVRVTHRATLHAASFYRDAFGLSPDDRSLVVLPMFYISGIVDHVIPHLLTGGSCVIVDGFHAGRVARMLAAEGATWFMGVPAMVGLLLREDERFGAPALPALRLIAYGGAPFPAAWVAELRSRFPATELCEIYGLTESHSPATIVRGGDVGVRPGCVGWPIPGVEARLDDGELLLRGPNITPGYYDDDVSTAAAFTNGWFRTGDIARIDHDGSVFLLDRKKDMIQRGGFKVYSVELECVLLQHPDIEQAAVFGVPVELAGEDVVAYVVEQPGRAVTGASLRHWLAGRVADYQVPRYVRIVAELPRARTGKVDKLALRERELASAGERHR